MASVRSNIMGEVHRLVGSRGDTPGFERPPGDDGILGADAVAWAVHGDFATMMIGGVGALLLQMLHPAALAGVWDHSNFRRDMNGRLRRTAQFMAGTTFGSTAHADALIAKVRRIHDAVAGTLPDGTPYAANDPATLTWVHVAGAASFLAAYRRYRNPLLSGAAQDRYYAETAEIARRLGATDVPTTRAATAQYIRETRRILRSDARSREVARVIMASPAGTPAATAAGHLVLQAGVDLMPTWASAMHGLHVPALRRPLVRAGALGMGSVLRWALNGPREAVARPA